MATEMDDAAVIAGVTDTLYDYCTFLDEKRLDDFAALFTADCHFEEGTVATGRDHIRGLVRKFLLKFDALSHHLSNIRITRTGPDTAEAVSNIFAWHQLNDGGQLKIWGRYVDKLRFEDGRWKYCEHIVLMQGCEGAEVPIRRVAQAELA